MLKQIDKNTIKESSKYFDEVRKIKDIENKNILYKSIIRSMNWWL